MKNDRISFRLGDSDRQLIEEVKKQYFEYVGVVPNDSEALRYALVLARGVCKGVYK